MLLLILAVSLLTLGLVMYAVGKWTKRKWLKHLAVIPAVAGVVILLVIVYFLIFVGSLPVV